MSLKEFIKSKPNLKGFHVEADPDTIGLDFNIMKQEHKNGVQLADPCRIDQMKEHFAWKRGHQNAHIGFPNSGKTQMVMFLMLVKSLRDNWKWAIWSPEMRSANFVDGKVKKNYNDMAYDLMATRSGKTPYKHVSEKFGVPLMSLEEMEEGNQWIKDHFIFLDPENRKIDALYETIVRIYETYGCDGFLFDPYKNVEQDPNVRDDIHLHRTFAKFTDLTLETNTVMNWIAHPRSGVTRVDKNDKLMVCNQYMISGGAAWDDSMDGIFSYHRPNVLEDLNDPWVQWFNLKQRKQELVARRGMVDEIYFDIKKRRYYFSNYDPIDQKMINTKDNLPF